jgi:hypothetical protein
MRLKTSAYALKFFFRHHIATYEDHVDKKNFQKMNEVIR